jgi:SAM-dependent methyltransferase
MKTALLSLLRCPLTGSRLVVLPGYEIAENEEMVNGILMSEVGNHMYPIRNFIPRFVPQSNYADNFGMQWNHFAKTQLDSHSGHSISADRFWMATGWKSAEMKDRWVLDVGCGSGRFAEVALDSGANVVSLDYSSAVDACYSNLRHHPNLHVIQGDIYALPFALETFSFVYSLGVLQHTPDVAKVFAALPPLVCGGGRLCVDYYEKSFKSSLLPKYWLRPLTKDMPKQKLFSLLQKVVPVLLPISRAFGKIPLLGKLLKRAIPVANYDALLPLTEKQLVEWALLDTFDWLSPAYDNPQTNESARYFMEQAHMEEIEVLKAGHLVARGRKSLQFI